MVGDLDGRPHVVRDGKHSEAKLARTVDDEIIDYVGGYWVESGRGFVEKKNVRVGAYSSRK